MCQVWCIELVTVVSTYSCVLLKYTHVSHVCVHAAHTAPLACAMQLATANTDQSTSGWSCKTDHAGWVITWPVLHGAFGRLLLAPLRVSIPPPQRTAQASLVGRARHSSEQTLHATAQAASPLYAVGGGSACMAAVRASLPSDASARTPKSEQTLSGSTSRSAPIRVSILSASDPDPPGTPSKLTVRPSLGSTVPGGGARR